MEAHKNETRPCYQQHMVDLPGSLLVEEAKNVADCDALFVLELQICETKTPKKFQLAVFFNQT